MNEQTQEIAAVLADPPPAILDQLLEGEFGDPRDWPLWRRQHLAAAIAQLTEAAKRAGIAEGVDATWHLKALRAEAWRDGYVDGARDTSEGNYGATPNPHNLHSTS